MWVRRGGRDTGKGFSVRLPHNAVNRGTKQRVWSVHGDDACFSVHIEKNGKSCLRYVGEVQCEEKRVCATEKMKWKM